MKTIPLTHGQVALVDDEDYDWLMQWKWYVHCSRGIYYANRHYRINGIQHTVHMHREIATPSADQDVDHMDGDGLNNQRANLRCCSHSENSQNQRLRSDNTTGYKGVSKCSDRKNKWQAHIAAFGRRISLGRFDSAEAAYAAYCDAAARLHGNFARV